LLRSAGPWESTFVTSLVTSVFKSGRKLDAWVCCVNSYRADLSSTRKPDSADLTYSTTCLFPPFSSILYTPLPPSPPYSIVLCVQSQDTSVVQERWKPESCLIMFHFQAVIEFSLPYAHTCTTTQGTCWVHKKTPHTRLRPLRFKVKFQMDTRNNVSDLCSCHFSSYTVLILPLNVHFWSYKWAETLTKFTDFKKCSVIQGACSRE